MVILKNKGMFLEKMINIWCEWLSDNNYGFIQKTPVNYKLINSDNIKFTAIYDNNNYCDYMGIYNQKYIEFEAKETEQNFFSLNNISKSQLNKLIKISELGGISFVIIYFHLYNEFYLIPSVNLLEFKNKKIPYNWFNHYGIRVNLNNLLLKIDEKINLIS